jgi:hypothetical protein
VVEPPKPEISVKAFCSYAHRDEALREEFERHIAVLKHNNWVQIWHDRQIGAGEDWAGDIDENLNRADIILLFVSADFLASDYCYKKELSRALERAEQKQALVFPIIVRPCDWSDAPFAHLQAVPAGGKAVTSWTNRDEAWWDVAVSLKSAVRQAIARQKEELVAAFLARIEASREERRTMDNMVTEADQKMWQITQNMMINKRKGKAPDGDFGDYLRP